MVYAIRFGLSLLLGASLFVACNPSAIRNGEYLALAVMDSVQLGTGVVVRVDSIRDSRCPLNAQCIVAGDVWVKLTIRNQTGTIPRRLTLYHTPTNRSDSTGVIADNQPYKILLRDAVPHFDVQKQVDPAVKQKAIIQISPL